MIILLKLTCFSIWMLIMILIIRAVLRKHKIPVQDYSHGWSKKLRISPNSIRVERKHEI